MPDSAVIVQMRQWKAALLREEREQMQQMARAWMGVERALDGQMAALAAEMHDIAEFGGTVSFDLLQQNRRYRLLMVQLQDELGKYTRYADRTITEQQARMARLGLEQGVLAIEAQGVRVGFARLPVEAVQNMVGLAGNGSPLRTLLTASWPDAAEGLTSALVNGIALGHNPRKVARAMAAGSTRSLDRMMTIARTEQLRVYREASVQSYKSSGVVSGYMRIATHDKRCCGACIADEGHFYELNEVMPTHPNCRCAMIPRVMGVRDPQWKKGEEWFREQDAATQTSILGKGRYEAWQSGRFDLGELVTVKPNATWGDSLQVTPLRELAGPRVARAVVPIANFDNADNARLWLRENLIRDAPSYLSEEAKRNWYEKNLNLADVPVDIQKALGEEFLAMQKKHGLTKLDSITSEDDALGAVLRFHSAGRDDYLVTGINVNPGFIRNLRDYDNITLDEYFSMASKPDGGNPRQFVAPDVNAAMYHEATHYYHVSKLGIENPLVKEAYRKAVDSGLIKHISQYAEQDANEFFAEAALHAKLYPTGSAKLMDAMGITDIWEKIRP